MSVIDPEDKDQLSLWDKLNRLYGQGERIAPPPEAAFELGMEELEPLTAEDGKTAAGPAPLDPRVATAPPHPDQEPANPVCRECERYCKQGGERFALALCPKAGQQEHAARIRVQALHGPTGVEKLNENCRRCRRSCKQSTHRLNRMLCLGFEPLPLNG